MSGKNIILEGFFNDLFKILKLHPKLKNNKKIKNDIYTLNKKVTNLEKMMNDELKSYGSKKKIKLKQYKLKDFIKGV
tara:strand:+ start:198 stop:428 length:231 start_codon:yes stop_codon:yes gene_type:complete